KCVALPMRSPARAARTPACILETGEEPICVGPCVPPDRDEITERPCRAVGMPFADERRPANRHPPMGASRPPTTSREELAVLHLFGCGPVAHEQIREPLHFRNDRVRGSTRRAAGR